VSIKLPLEDLTVDDEPRPLFASGESLIQTRLCEVLEREFPDVAALGLEACAKRLTRETWPDGSQVFYLDHRKKRPGLCVAFFSPMEIKTGDNGGLVAELPFWVGVAGARLAEVKRREYWN
jgi:hypothetical protein